MPRNTDDSEGFQSASEGINRRQADRDDDSGEAFSEAEEVSNDELSEEEKRQALDDSEDDGEDLFDGDVTRDYEPNPELDRYDPEMLDDSADHSDLTAEQRREAERDIRRRDRERLASGGLATGQAGIAAMFANLTMSDEEGDDEETAGGTGEMAEEDRERRRRRLRALQTQAERANRPDEEMIKQAKESLPECDFVQMGGHRGSALAPVALWSERVEELIATIFEGLLWLTPLEDQTNKKKDRRSRMGVPTGMEHSYYLDRIQTLVREEQSSLIVDWNHVGSFCPQLEAWVINLPLQVLGVFDRIATRVTSLMYPKLYANKLISVRLSKLPIVDSIRTLSVAHINKLVVVEGVCMRRSDVLPRLRVVYFECLKCGCDSNGPFDQRVAEDPHLKKTCVACQGNGPFTVSRERTIFQNYQKVCIQELTSAVPPGHVPRQKVAVLLGDLVDKVRPGDDFILAGILEARQDTATNAKMGFPIFSTWIVANNLQKRRERQIAELSERDIDVIKKLSRNPAIREKVISSIAPSIWGHRHIKTALAMAMFGGVRHEAAGKHVVRGDINVLVIGDPGLGKSQFLKYVEQTFPRTILTTGKGASAVGLTAAVRRDPMTGEWTLEGGAFVLADEGICLIDEFDKMSDKDRVSIHEAMEQQSISISKAGIVTSLRARCSVIAAANPIGGKYNASLTLADNVDLTDPILSRFDVVAVVRDQSYPIHDEHLAEYVLESHMDAHPDADTRGIGEQMNTQDNPDTTLDDDGFPNWVHGTSRIPDDVLRSYIIYARKWCCPEIRVSDQSKLVEFYASLRQATSQSGGLPMTVRHLESIMRMATANAKIRLSRFVDKADLDFAISTMLESFIQSQKYAVSVALGRKFGKYRALAASPDELLENLLLEMITRKVRDRMARDISRHEEHDEFQTDIYADVSLEEFKVLSKTLHAMPEVVVHNFTQSRRFQEKYNMVQRAGNSFIEAKPIAASA